MYVGKTKFAQIMDFVPWTSFRCISNRYGGDAHVRKFNCAEIWMFGLRVYDGMKRGVPTEPLLYIYLGGNLLQVDVFTDALTETRTWLPFNAASVRTLQGCSLGSKIKWFTVLVSRKGG